MPPAELVSELSAKQSGDDRAAAECTDAVAGEVRSELQFFTDIDGQEEHDERADSIDERAEAEQVHGGGQLSVLLNQADCGDPVRAGLLRGKQKTAGP